jgi:hypothetical protein
MPWAVYSVPERRLGISATSALATGSAATCREPAAGLPQASAWQCQDVVEPRQGLDDLGMATLYVDEQHSVQSTCRSSPVEGPDFHGSGNPPAMNETRRTAAQEPRHRTSRGGAEACFWP